MPAKYGKSSIYKNTKVKDFYLDLWSVIKIEPKEDDIRTIITPIHDKRPDLLAYELYGTPNLYWVFALRNKDILIDPVGDFTAGTIIMVPSVSYIKRLIA